MKKINFIFLICGLLFLGCEAKQSDDTSSKTPDKAVNLSQSEGCAEEKSDKKTDEVSFAQSSSSMDEVSFEEDEKSDSGCTL